MSSTPDLESGLFAAALDMPTAKPAKAEDAWEAKFELASKILAVIDNIRKSEERTRRSVCTDGKLVGKCVQTRMGKEGEGRSADCGPIGQ